MPMPVHIQDWRFSFSFATQKKGHKSQMNHRRSLTDMIRFTHLTF